MFMWPLQTHFCFLSSYVYVSKTCTRTAYGLWMLVKFGGNLRFSLCVFIWTSKLTICTKAIYYERRVNFNKSYMDCIFKIWEVKMLIELNVIVNGIVKISFFLVCRLGAHIFNMYNWYIKAELILIHSFKQIH